MIGSVTIFFHFLLGQLGQLGRTIKEQVKAKKEAFFPYRNPS